jgi:hypothetical protein
MNSPFKPFRAIGPAHAAVRHSLGAAAERLPPQAAARWPILHALDGAALAFFLGAMGWLGLLWVRMVLSPAPQEMREGALVMTTLALLDGRNPYASAAPLAAGLAGGNLYGILYPLAVAPFALVLGPGLPTHRLVNGLALLVAAALVWRGARAAGAARLPALLAALFSLAGWLYWVGPTVRPDGLGLALMLGTLVVAAPDPASPRRFAAALALSLGGFAAKLYFVGGVLIVAAYAFLFVSWRRGLAMGAAAVAATGLWALLLEMAMPGWGALVLRANIGAARYDVGHLVRQGWDWILFSLPLLAGLSAVLWCLPLSRWRGGAGFWGFAALCGLAVLLVSLGGHGGAHMTYFFHLLTPPLAIAVAAAMGEAEAPRRALILSLPVAVALNAHWFVIDPKRFAEAEARFAVAAEALAAASSPLVTTEFAALAALAGHAPVETGHTEYMLPPAEQAALRRRLSEALRARAFDIAIVNRNDGGLVLARDVEAAGYIRAATIPVDLVWAMQSWDADLWRAPP